MQGDIGILEKLEGHFPALLFIWRLPKTFCMTCHLPTTGWVASRTWTSSDGHEGMGYEFDAMMAQLEKAQRQLREAAEKKAEKEKQERRDAELEDKKRRQEEEALKEKEDHARNIREEEAGKLVNQALESLHGSVVDKPVDTSLQCAKTPVMDFCEEARAQALVVFDSWIQPFCRLRPLPVEAGGDATARAWTSPCETNRLGLDKPETNWTGSSKPSILMFDFLTV